MFVTFAIGLLGFVTYLFGVNPISLIIVGLTLIGFWKDRDFDNIAADIVHLIKSVVGFFRDLFTKAKSEAPMDAVSVEAEEAKDEEDEEDDDEEEEDEEEEEEEEEEDEVHA